MSDESIDVAYDSDESDVKQELCDKTSEDKNGWMKKHCKVLGILVIAVLGTMIAVTLVVHFSNNEKETTVIHEKVVDSKENCKYYLFTPNVTAERLKSFGDRCEFGSLFVNNTCGGSGVLCSKCRNGMLLPRYCFCDKPVNCKYDELKSRTADHPRKYNCTLCLEIFVTSVYKNRIDNITQCDSSMSRSAVDTPKCKDGYAGVMCNVIIKRVCEKEEGRIDNNLKSCENEGSNDETCILERKYNYLCHSFKDSNKDKQENRAGCSIN